MARIKKRGLDYFPFDTDFIQQRSVRRILKQKGDAALTVIIYLLNNIYGKEGYYVKVDNCFYEDLADELYQLTEEDVEGITLEAVKQGLFDADLFQREGILTSAEIQRQFLFCTKRRNSIKLIEERYRLIENGSTEQPESETENAENGTETTLNATLKAENAEETYFGTQSKAQQSKAQQSKKNSLLKGSPMSGGTPSGRKEEVKEGELFPEEEELEEVPETTESAETVEDSAASSASVKGCCTEADLDKLQPPTDGVQRNLDGLRLTMTQFRISPSEQRAIILKSNFGQIGHPVWRGFPELRNSRGKIKYPGRFLLSLCKNSV
ncbi:MAG: DUF4373 domain-containing protein [Bacteroides sp.]|nr:DUF4373 domain-containing protein [Bacteroides sp.]